MVVIGGDIYKLTYIPRTARTGDLYVGIHSEPPSGVLLFDGSTKARTAYPELWAMISAGRLPSVTEFDWLWATGDVLSRGAVGAFSTGDGSTTFRLPDWRGLFPRGAGINSILTMANGTKYTGGSLAAVMLDMMQGHQHSPMNGTILHYVPSGGNLSTGAGSSVFGYASTGTPRTDGTNGEPRKGDETRPASVSVNFGIYFE